MEADIFKLSQRTGIGAQLPENISVTSELFVCLVAEHRAPLACACPGQPTDRPTGSVLNEHDKLEVQTSVSLTGILVVKAYRTILIHTVIYAGPSETPQVVDACKRNSGFYLASIGGIAGTIADECFKSIELPKYPELGTEAKYKVEVENFPAFIVIDKGNDFFKKWRLD